MLSSACFVVFFFLCVVVVVVQLELISPHSHPSCHLWEELREGTALLKLDFSLEGQALLLSAEVCR